uniref:Putative immunoglobulin a1 protease autotransporter-like protein n=1 Tax=Phlebotomus kandelakii TaxID=1109342 RepID=A0A6B2EAE9_9DIPT
MTWHWWSHWFWITLALATVSQALPMSSVTSDTHLAQLKVLEAREKVYSKREPLKFPLAAQTDDDDELFGVDRSFAAMEVSDGGRLNWISPHHPEKDKSIKRPENSTYEINLMDSNSSHAAPEPSKNATGEKSPEVSGNQEDHPENATGSIEASEAPENRTENDTVRPEMDIVQNDTVDMEVELQENDTIELDRAGRKSKVLTEYSDDLRIANLTTETKNLLARSAASSVTSVNDDELGSELSVHAYSAQHSSALNAGAISGICVAVMFLFVSAAVAGMILYRRRYINKPQTLSEPDSSGYIDDSTIRDNSDEMYSLDNDSFLNSLEAMTIQNYWTDNVKHTKL